MMLLFKVSAWWRSTNIKKWKKGAEHSYSTQCPETLSLGFRRCFRRCFRECFSCQFRFLSDWNGLKAHLYGLWNRLKVVVSYSAYIPNVKSLWKVKYLETMPWLFRLFWGFREDDKVLFTTHHIQLLPAEMSCNAEWWRNRQKRLDNCNKYVYKTALFKESCKLYPEHMSSLKSAYQLILILQSQFWTTAKPLRRCFQVYYVY